MSELPPLYTLGLNQADAARVAGDRPILPIPDGTAFPEADDEPGWILIGPGAPADAVVGLFERLGGRHGPWSPLLVRPEGDELAAIPLSPGYRTAAGEVRERVGAGGPKAGLLSFRHALRDLARIRHDLNNPLTAALAEVQLLLLDEDADSERGQALSVVEAQIRRLGALVAELAPYRTPDR